MRSCPCLLPHGVSPPALPLPSFAAPSSGRHGNGEIAARSRIREMKNSLSRSVSLAPLSVCLSLSLALPPCRPVDWALNTNLLTLPPSLSRPVSLSLSLCVSVFLSVSLSLSVCLSPPSLSFSPPPPFVVCLL